MRQWVWGAEGQHYLCAGLGGDRALGQHWGKLGALIRSWGLELPKCHGGWGQGYVDELRQCGLLLGWQQGDGISSSATISAWIVLSRAGFGGSGVHLMPHHRLFAEPGGAWWWLDLEASEQEQPCRKLMVSQGDAVTGAHCSLHI